MFHVESALGPCLLGSLLCPTLRIYRTRGQCHYICSILSLYRHLGCCISGPCACLPTSLNGKPCLGIAHEGPAQKSGPEISGVWMSERASPFGTEPDLRTKTSLFCGVKCILVRPLFLSSALPKSTFIFSVHSQQFLFWWKCSIGLLAVCGLRVYFSQYKSPFPMRDYATSMVSWWWRLTTDLD